MRKTSLSLLPVMALVLVTGCGGGGSHSPSVTPVVYTGATTPAVLGGADDVAAFVGEATEGTEMGSISIAARAQGTPIAAAQPAKARPTLVLPRLATTLARLATALRPAASSSAFSQTVNGTCAGTAVFSGSSASSGNSFTASGAMVCSNYCNTSLDGTQVVLNGTVQFTMSGTDDSDFTLQLSTPRVAVQVGGDSFAYAFDYSVAVTAGVSGTVSMSCVFQAPDKQVYQVLDCQVTGDPELNTLSLSGQFYDPVRGYVNVSTPTPLTYGYCSGLGVILPTAGTLQVQGANSVTGTFTGQGCSQYQVCYNSSCQTYSWN